MMHVQSSTTAFDFCASRYTGKERDAESGLDNFDARYFGSTMGRFMSPDYNDDPDPVPYADFTNPQSLNLYSYVQNNPLTNTDPDGHDCVVQSRTSVTTENVSVSTGNCDNVNVGDGQTKTYVPGTVTSISVNGGNSLDIGYNSYDGQSSGVTNANAAPIPDNTNLAYNWGNNPQGYQTFGAANKLVTYATVGATIAYGIPIAAMLGADAAAATAAARANIIFRLGHGLDLAAKLNTGHSAVLVGEGALKNAIAAAIASGAVQQIGSRFEGVVSVAGTLVKFTGGWNGAQMIVSNVMRADHLQ
jgi:RHS repeat-associated protein